VCEISEGFSINHPERLAFYNDEFEELVNVVSLIQNNLTVSMSSVMLFPVVFEGFYANGLGL
jgi:hypothetical protein